MDSLTIQAVNNSLATATGEKLLQAELQNIPPQLVIKSGDNILLQVFTDNFSSTSSLFEATLVVENREIPVQIKTELPMETEQKPVADIIAKAVGKTEQGALPVQIVSVNGTKAETYLASIKQGENFQIKTETPVWENKTGEAPRINLLPLKIASTVENLVEATSLPTEARQQIVTEAKQLELPLAIKMVIQSPLNGDDIMKPLQQTFDKFVQLPETERSFPQLQKEVQTILQSFAGKDIPAVVQTKGEGNIAVLSTVLGDVLPEVPLKIPAGTPLLLQAGDIVIKPVLQEDNTEILPEKKQQQTFSIDEKNSLPIKNIGGEEFPLPKSPVDELLSKLADILPVEKFPATAKSFPDILLSEDKVFLPQTSKEMPPLLKVLEPIISDKQIVQELVNKLPTADNKLLSNIVNFVKAADSGEVKKWLGQELVEKITAKGVDGKETMSRLSQYVSSNIREGVVWRSVEIPFWGEGLSSIKLSVKKKKQDSEQENQQSLTKKEARFILETDFSKLGKFQFDGFSIATERRFDLIVRTSKMLPDDFCAHVINLFKTTLHAVDYHGNIKLNLKENFIKIEEDEVGEIRIKDGLYI